MATTRTARPAGFTLLEVLIALLLLTGVFLAVAQLLAVAGRAAGQSRAIGLGAVLAAQKMEQLRALSWAYDIDGTPLDGLSLSPAGSVVADLAGLVDYFDQTGGSGRRRTAASGSFACPCCTAGRLVPRSVRARSGGLKWRD
jgi:prepilin-type N-terminal cleavage/methylation domain-containing protein